jgi:hypothetical protein
MARGEGLRAASGFPSADRDAAEHGHPFCPHGLALPLTFIGMPRGRSLPSPFGM